MVKKNLHSFVPMKVNVKLIKDKIFALLIEYPHLRDDDNKLSANIWHSEITKLGHNAEKISGKDLLGLIANGKLTTSASILRCRRKLQELNPELRGVYYIERNNNTTKINQQIRDINGNK